MRYGRVFSSVVSIACISFAAATAVADQSPGMGYYVYSSQSGNYQANVNDFNGPYLGVNIGVNPQQVKVIYAPAAGRINELHETKLDLLGGMYGGYGWAMSQFYIGVEANGRYNFSGKEYAKTLGSSPSSVSYNDFKQTWSAGASVLIGGIISDNSLLYLITGVQFSRFDYAAGATTQANVPQLKKTKMGFRIGAGVSLQLSNSINADLRYQYERYSAIAGAADGSTPEFKPNNNMITFGISYHFA